MNNNTDADSKQHLFKLGGQFLINIPAENEHEAEEKVNEALDSLMEATNHYARCSVKSYGVQNKNIR